MSAIGYLLSLLVWPALGWFGDTPRRIHPDEITLSHVAAWTSVAAYSLWLALSFFVPIWGMALALWVGLILARRIAASSRWEPIPVRIKDLVRELKELGWALPTLAGAAVFSVLSAIYMPSNIIGDAIGIGVLLGAPLTVGLLGWAGLRHASSTRAYRADRARVVPQLATIFAVAPTVVDEQSGISIWSDGIQISPVPPAIAAKLAPGNRGALDAQISQVLPGFELDPDSDHQCIRLVPVSGETASRRDALVASGGLLAGASTTGSEGLLGDLVLSEDDLR